MQSCRPIVILLVTITLGFSFTIAGTADPSSDLLKAASKTKEEIDKVLTLLERGANVNAQDKEGRTALHLSALRDHSRIVEILLARGANVEVRDNEGNTALQLAAKLDRKKIVSLLIEGGARIFIPETPRNSSERLLADLPQQLHDAAAKGDLLAIQRLLRSGVPVDVAVPGKPETALLAACAKGQLDAAKALLAGGADSTKQNKEGRTALHLAASSGSLPLVEMLAQTQINLNSQDSSKKTAADIAVDAQSGPVLSLLLDRGINPSDRDKALKLALSTKNKLLAEKLLSTATSMTANDFLVAVSFGLSDSTRKYLDAGNKPPPLALALAARNGDVLLCEELLNKGVNPNFSGADTEWTPLVVALRGRHPEVARLLLARGADPGIPSSGSNAPASLARSAGYEDIANKIDKSLQVRASLVLKRLQSMRRLRLSVSVPGMQKVTRQGNNRIIEIDLTKKPSATDERWTAAVRDALEEIVSSFGFVLVDSGQDADLDVIFQGYSAYSPDMFEPISRVLFSAVVQLNTPDLGSLHKYAWTVTFLNNYSKYFSPSGEANEAAVLADFKDAVKADLMRLLPPAAPRVNPRPKAGAPSPVKKATRPRGRPGRSQM